MKENGESGKGCDWGAYSRFVLCQKNQQKAREDGGPLRRDIRARGHDELILVGSYLELRETRRGTLPRLRL